MNDMRKKDVLEHINHGMPKQAIVKEIEGNLEIDSHLYKVKNEFSTLRSLNAQLRPLYGERASVVEKLMILDMGIASKVAIEYPPRKGSEADRLAMKQRLQLEDASYVEAMRRKAELDDEIESLNYEMKLVEREASTSRRIIELHTSYVQLISKY